MIFPYIMRYEKMKTQFKDDNKQQKNDKTIKDREKNNQK